jgi:LPXTG-motif cell wall-anchored protein
MAVDPNTGEQNNGLFYLGLAGIALVLWLAFKK